MPKKRNQNPPDLLKSLSLFDETTMSQLLSESEDGHEEVTDRAAMTKELRTNNSTVNTTGIAHPTHDEWKRLYEAAIRFRDLAPWNWLYEDQIFSVVNPEDGEVGYCSVMGAGGEFHALSVYRGYEGLLSYERLKRFWADESTSSRLHDDSDVFVSQKSLLASFEGSQDVHKRDRKVFESLGLRFRGKQAWPVLRSYEPGWAAWFLTAKECRFLTQALEQSILVALRGKEHPSLLDERPGCILTRTSTTDTGDLEWVDWWPAWPYLEDESDEKFVYPPVDVDEMRLKRVMRAGKPSGAWEVDISYAPFKVQEGERPYIPRLMLCVHHQSGMILSANPAEPTAESSEFVEQFVHAMELYKLVPDQIVVKRESIAQLLSPIAHVIGTDLLLADFLPGVEMAREEMRGFVG